MAFPICSVVIPAYNSSTFIEQAVQSILLQTLDAFEVLVVDDGSTDTTQELVRHLAEKDPRVTLIAHKTNMGVAVARNTGVAHANAEWVAFLDSDDIWQPEKLQRQMELCSAEGIVFCYTGAKLIDQQGLQTNKTIAVPTVVNYDTLLKGNVIITSTVLIRRDILLEFPMERSDLHEDYITWLRIFQKYGAVQGINEPLISYRVTKGSKSRNKLRSAQATWKTYRYMGLSVPKALKCFGNYAIHGLRRYYSR